MIDNEKQRLFKQVRVKLGSITRKLEITDDMLCDLLDIAISDYSQVVQNFVIQNNWATLFGKQVGTQLTANEISHAFSLKTFDLTKDYASWFSKQVGLQQHGKWELKKDFIEIEAGKQVYQIPAGREVHRAMWVDTSSSISGGIMAAYSGFGATFGNGVVGTAGVGAMSMFGGGGAGGMGYGLWALPASDLAYLATDMSFKNKLFRGELVYKMTAGPDGTHLLHLMSTPGSKLTFNQGNPANGLSLAGCYIWYTYYDVNSLEEQLDCRKLDSDLIVSPDQVPMEEMDFSMFNQPAKATIRQLLVGHTAETLGLIRGKFSGSLNIIANSLTMDYNMLINFGQKEKDAAINDLKERMQRLTPEETIKRQAEMLQSMREIQKNTPLGMYVI